MIVNTLSGIGQMSLAFLGGLGHFTRFVWRTLICGLTPPYYTGVIQKNFLEIGYFSLPVVGFTALFTGMVLALQSYTGFSRFQGAEAIASIVALSITRELGPVLTGLMIAGRVGGAIAAEIGTMQVTQQIDALITMSTNPIRYLVFPRILAGIIVLPFLTLVADIIGILGGYLVAVFQLDFPGTFYLEQTTTFLESSDVISGLVKASAFGLIITLASCYQGYHTYGGAAGVGRSSTQAVVTASIGILLANYFLTGLFFQS